MVRLVMLLSLLVGCTRYGLFDLPEAGLRPEISSEFNNPGLDVKAAWTDVIVNASEAWNTALVEAGCEPMFHIAVDGEPAYEVKLWTQADWPHSEDDIGVLSSGDAGEGRIDVLTLGPFATKNLATLVHEFGHALGLEHVHDGADSVMTAIVNWRTAPTKSDIAAACPH